MDLKRLSLIAALALGAVSPLAPALAPAALAQPAVQPKEGWYKTLADFSGMRADVDIPPKKGVVIIDSRPAARQFDPGHIPGAINIPDSQFDKMIDKLPADKTTKLIFYCGGLDCLLSHNSAVKAEKLGFRAISVYAEGMPDWKAKGGPVSVSGAYIRKLIDEKAVYMIIDARPKRVADKGMIPTAVNISDTDFEKSVDKLPKDKATQLIFYCGGLECVLSDKSADKAKKLGYTNVVTYPEGYPEWEKLFGAGPAAAAEAPKAGEAAKPTAAALVAGKEKGSVTPASFDAAYKTAPAAMTIVDVRDAREFATGAIKGAINIPMNDLEKKVSTLPKDKPVVFVCGTGARSGEAYDTVKLIAPEVNASFIDAPITFNADGTYAIGAKK